MISKSSDSLVDRFPGGELERVLSLLREHNLALLTLILHLMVSIQNLYRQDSGEGKLKKKRDETRKSEKKRRKNINGNDTEKGAQESIPSLAGREDNPICRTGPPGYIGWRNQFLGIDSWAP